MCIRDSTCGFLDSAKAESLQAIGDAMDENGRVIVTGCMGAVSYTHLRAHETVLDLVCRLLLEKKKL